MIAGTITFRRIAECHSICIQPCVNLRKERFGAVECDLSCYCQKDTGSPRRFGTGQRKEQLVQAVSI